MQVFPQKDALKYRVWFHFFFKEIIINVSYFIINSCNLKIIYQSMQFKLNFHLEEPTKIISNNF